MKQVEIREGGIYTNLRQLERRHVTGIYYDSVMMPALVKLVLQDEPPEFWCELIDPARHVPIGWLVEKKGSAVVTYVNDGLSNAQCHCTLLSFARWAKHRCIHLRWAQGLRRYNRAVAREAARE